MSTEMLNREGAASDLLATGAPARLLDGDLFFVKSVPATVAAEDADAARWCGLRTKGTNPSLWDTGDPDALAALVTAHHDYPSEDLFFSLLENVAAR